MAKKMVFLKLAMKKCLNFHTINQFKKISQMNRVGKVNKTL